MDSEMSRPPPPPGHIPPPPSWVPPPPPDTELLTTYTRTRSVSPAPSHGPSHAPSYAPSRVQQWVSAAAAQGAHPEPGRIAEEAPVVQRVEDAPVVQLVQIVEAEPVQTVQEPVQTVQTAPGPATAKDVHPAARTNQPQEATKETRMRKKKKKLRADCARPRGPLIAIEPATPPPITPPPATPPPATPPPAPEVEAGPGRTVRQARAFTHTVGSNQISLSFLPTFFPVLSWTRM